MDLLKYFFEFFFSRDSKIRDKFILALIIIATIAFIDMRLGFSWSYFTNNKIEKIERVQRLLESEKLTTYQRNMLTNMQNDAFLFARSMTKSEHDSTFYGFWYTVSYSGLIALFALFMTLNQIFAFTWQMRLFTFRQRITQAISSLFILAFITIILAVFAWLFAYIPSPPVAFLLNLITQCVFIYALYLAFGKSSQSQ